MAEVFGFDEAAMDAETLEVNANSIEDVYQESAKLIVNRSKSIASSKGLQVTGALVGGITEEVDGNGFRVGWGGRPNLHGYFHEIGTYKDPPRPHIRPASDQSEDQIYTNVQKKLIEGV